MFDQTFTDTSGGSEPAFNGLSWIIASALAALAFLGWYLLVPVALGGATASEHAIQAAVFGAVPSFLTALMLCYVVADARRLGLAQGRWFAVALLLNCIGFFIYLIYSANKTKQWKRAAIPISYAIELMVVAPLLIYPLIATSALPRSELASFLSAPAPPRAATPVPEPMRASARRVSLAELLRIPAVIPRSIERVRDRPAPPSTQSLAPPGPGSVQNGAPWGGPFIGASVTPPPPPPPAPVQTVPQRIRVGGAVEAAKAIYRPMPVYPSLAKYARVEGTVRLEAVIGRGGLIENLRVISGHPLLVPAALSAVEQWRYEPTLLDGTPVEVVTEIDVNFTLSGS